VLQLSPAATALVVIDVQRVFDDPVWGARSNRAFEANLARLLARWRAAGGTVVNVRHRSAKPGGRFQPGTPGFAFKPEAEPAPGEMVFEKTVNSAFIGTGLEEWLRTRGIDTLIVAGITTDHCVSTTARMGANLGFEILLPGDATATFDKLGPSGRYFDAQTMHDAALAALHGEFATVITTDALIGALRAAA
jgi:nicotinamidase-related amidase